MTGDVLVLLNQDTIVRPGWLVALVRAFADEQVGIVSAKLLEPDGYTLSHTDPVSAVQRRGGARAAATARQLQDDDALLALLAK